MSYSGPQQAMTSSSVRSPAAEPTAASAQARHSPYAESPRMVAQRQAMDRIRGASNPVIQRVEMDAIVPHVNPGWGTPLAIVRLFDQWLQIGYRESLASLSFEQAGRLWHPFSNWFQKNVETPYEGGREAFLAAPGEIRVRVPIAPAAAVEPAVPAQQQLELASPDAVMEPEMEAEETSESSEPSGPVPVLAVYRGLHYGDPEFAGKDLQEEARRQTFLSPAAATLLTAGEIGTAVKRVQADMAGLYEDRDTTKWWNSQQGRYEKPIFAVIQRYVQDFRQFQVESIMGNARLAQPIDYTRFWASEYGKQNGAVHIEKVLGGFGLPPFNADQLEVLQGVLSNLHMYASNQSLNKGKQSNLTHLKGAMQSRQIMQDPFLSTTVDAVQAAKYALGEKITKESDQRTQDIVGRLCIYLMSRGDFGDNYNDALDIERLSSARKIEFNSRMGKEKEITFVGGIHPQDYVGHENAIGGESAQTLAGRGRKKAKDSAGELNAVIVENAGTAATRQSIMGDTKV